MNASTLLRRFARRFRIASRASERTLPSRPLTFERGEEAGHFRLSGELTFATAAEALRISVSPLFRDNGSVAALVVDLDGVQRTDSSGLSLLLEWTRRARRAGRRIAFANPPRQLRALAQLGDVDEALAWS